MAKDNGKNEAEIQKVIDELEGSDRVLKGAAALLILAIAVTMSLFHLYTAGFGTLSNKAQGAIHLAFAMTLAFLIYPYKKKTGQSFIPWYDWLFAALSAFIGFYMVYFQNEMARRSGSLFTWDFSNPIFWDVIVGGLLILLLLETTRRVIGLPLVILALVFMLFAYEWVGPYLPIQIAHNGFSISGIIQGISNTTGIYGTPIYVSSTFVIVFILFGAFLEVTGAGKMFIDFALGLFGPMRGGPAKAAVVSSGLMGSISGSSVANAVTTGTFTIPLMKKVGFKPHVAGGIEVAASSSGQFLPPVMGAAAFIMAEFTSIPYVEIIKAAAIPAILSYIAILFMVHIEAVKNNIQGIPRSELIPIKEVLLARGYMILPVLALIAMLILRFSPMKASFIAIIASIGLAFFTSRLENRRGAGFAVSLFVIGIAYVLYKAGIFDKWIAIALVASLAVAFLGILIRRKSTESINVRFGWRELIAGFELGAKNAIGVAAACATAGILTGVVTLTGLGPKLSTIIVSFAGNQVWLALLLTMVACIILGMGLPTTATYIVLAAVMAPSLTELGFSLMAAHLFVFYYGILADDTPPINLPAYATAGIAKADPVKTGIQGFKYDSGALLLPFAFITNETIILQTNASLFEVIHVIITALIGIVAFVTFIQNFMITKYRWYERLLALVSAIVLIDSGWLTDLIGIGLLAVIFSLQYVRKKKATTTVVQA